MHSSQLIAFARSEINMQTKFCSHLFCNLMERTNITYIKCALSLIMCSCAPKLAIHYSAAFTYSYLPRYLQLSAMRLLEQTEVLPFNLQKYRHLSSSVWLSLSATVNFFHNFRLEMHPWHHVILSRNGPEILPFVTDWQKHSASFISHLTIGTLINYNQLFILLSSALQRHFSFKRSCHVKSITWCKL